MPIAARDPIGAALSATLRISAGGSVFLVGGDLEVCLVRYKLKKAVFIV